MGKEERLIEQAFAEALSDFDSRDGYECRNCGEVFDSGRDARQHMFTEHDDPKGVKILRE